MMYNTVLKSMQAGSTLAPVYRASAEERTKLCIFVFWTRPSEKLVALQTNDSAPDRRHVSSSF